MRMYRLILLFINLACLGFTIYMIITEGVRSNDIWPVIFICVYLILNITYIYFSEGSKDKEPWLITLYFKRKVLEEKKRVQSLQKELKQKDL